MAVYLFTITVVYLFIAVIQLTVYWYDSIIIGCLLTAHDSIKLTETCMILY